MQSFKYFRLLKINCRVVTDLPHQRHKSSSQHNLTDLLRTMPKEVKHVAELQKLRQRQKDKTAKCVPNTIYLQVLGTGAAGAPRSLYMFTDQTKYLFNCGEGAQRLAHEHKMKMAKLEYVFVTYSSWDNIGGIPGLALTLQDVGVPEINIYGTTVIDHLLQTARKFIVLRNMEVNVIDPEVNCRFKDSTMTVTCVPLRLPSDSIMQRSPPAKKWRDEDSSSDDEIQDYYAYERNFGRDAPSGSKQEKKKTHSPTLQKGTKRHCGERPGCVSFAYICRMEARPGTLNLEACVERGVPPGPLLGRLKSGEDIILNDGTLVYSKDVTSPNDPGAIFIVVECPSEEFLDVLLAEKEFVKYQGDVAAKENRPYLIVHFTPARIMKEKRYKEWMGRFPNTTSHLLLNDSNTCLGSTAVHRIQDQLNLLDKDIFHVLGDNGIPLSPEDIGLGSSQIVKMNNIHISQNADPEADGFPGKVIEGKTLLTIHLRPNQMVDESNTLYLTSNKYQREILSVVGFNKATFEMERQLSKLQIVAQEYPKILFLGTGSSIPNKNRNTTGILLRISEAECMLLDCGEGTFGQLVRYFGPDKWLPILKTLKAIFISHLHADHHIGLIGILKARLRENINSPLYLIAPKQLGFWLDIYDQRFEQVLETIQLVQNSDLVYNLKVIGEKYENTLKEALHMSSILTAPVRHCPNAFGVSLTHVDGWKITYSGDTLPCKALCELGMNSDVLIHEATMEDDLENEARLKMHSTTSQAIAMGQEMEAKFILLTHFSQRYAKVPRFSDKFSSNVGIAFDNMQVRLTDLPKLLLMYEPLKLMFGEHLEDLEQKAVKRQLKLERERKGEPKKDDSSETFGNKRSCVIG